MSPGPEGALDLLRAAATPRGFLASTEETANYRRVWARDGVVSGLGGLAAGDEALIAALAATLRTLGECQGPHGEIPSNVVVAEDGSLGRVSFGGTAGRVDCVPWFVIGVGAYCAGTRDRELAEELRPRVELAMDLLEAWEFNRGGLVYVPQSGTWADEYPQHGYLLYVQLLRLWALRSCAWLFDDGAAGRQAGDLAERVRVNYWPEPEGLRSRLVHSPGLYERQLAGAATEHFLTGFNPSGYGLRFDAWSNALSVLLGVARGAQRTRLLDFGQSLRDVGPTGLVPAFWPPIRRREPEWSDLETAAVHGFKNTPGRYHNGGVWPIVNAWWGLALIAAGRVEEARELTAGVERLNRGSGDAWEFPEFADAATGESGGTRRMAWSAAGQLLLHHGLASEALFLADGVER